MRLRHPAGKALPPSGNQRCRPNRPHRRDPHLARLLLSSPPMTLDTFLDPLAFAIVVGGTAIVAVLRGPAHDAANAARALAVLWRAPFDFGPARAELARAERVAHDKSLLAVDPALLRDPDVAEGFEAVAAGAAPDQVEALLNRLRDARATRHAAVHGSWAAAAETAPAMGMVGTLIGLVAMFRSMNDPATIGGAMATALLATLYGALLANLVCAPVAARLRRMSQLEDEARRALVPPFRRFAARETIRPRVAA